MYFIGLKFSDAVTPHMQRITIFHKKINKFLLFIIIFVFGGLVFSYYCFSLKLKVLEFISVEVVWTLVPAVSLIFIGFPSLSILYQEFPDYNCSKIIKVFGHQWYWRFRKSKTLEEYDRFLQNESFSFRCLDVDNPIILKVLTPVRFMISSADVIHSFALPNFGLKVDAVPGRINESFSFPLYLGKFYGQCSEICGANHSFMPISVEVLKKVVYLKRNFSKVKLIFSFLNFYFIYFIFYFIYFIFFLTSKIFNIFFFFFSFLWKIVFIRLTFFIVYFFINNDFW